MDQRLISEHRARIKFCKARVPLGLKAVYERSILWDPYDTCGEKEGVLTGKGPDGTLYVVRRGRDLLQGYVLDPQEKYLCTFCPAPAAEVEKDAQPTPRGYGGVVVQERYTDTVVKDGAPPAVTTAAGARR